jgi:glycosyltransferase involved in cell wall biosynthesis
MGSNYWVILTGEYPPQPGGVGDYTRQVARALAEAGDVVHVWAPAAARETPIDAGVHVHRLANGFNRSGRRQLATALGELPTPFRILVQYVPHAFGYKAMNLPFAWWLSQQRRQPIYIMFHEVALPWGRWHACKQNLLGVVTRVMAGLIARSAERVYVSIPAWERVLRPLAPLDGQVHWLPIFSNFPTEVDSCRVTEVRGQIAPGANALLIGHFGTFQKLVATSLRPTLVTLLRKNPGLAALLVGHGASAFASDLGNEAADLPRRIHARDGLPSEQVVAHLAACDLLIQPYPDGVSSRRSSLMCGLALGLPILTTEGPLSEPLWRESAAVALVPVSSDSDIGCRAETLLADRDERHRIGRRACELYRRRFALEHTIRVLRS